MIKDVLAEIAPDTDPDALAPDADLRDSLGLDSLDFLNFIVKVGERSGKRIDEDYYPRFATLAAGSKFLAGG